MAFMDFGWRFFRKSLAGFGSRWWPKLPFGQRSSSYSSRYYQRLSPLWLRSLFIIIPAAMIAVVGWLAIGSQQPLWAWLEGQAEISQPSSQGPSLGQVLDQGVERFDGQLGAWTKANRIYATPPDPFAGKLVRDWKLSSGEKAIALTFDDGPFPKMTEQVLDILQKEQIHATFFIIGSMLKAYPELGKRVVTDGHVIANHTWTHRIRKTDPATATWEVDRTAQLIEDLTGIQPRLFRPPGGLLHSGMDTYAQSKGYATVIWGTDTLDWRRPTAQVIHDRVVRGAHPGDIVLMHDGGGDRTHTIAALPKIIADLRAQGYRFVTVPEILALRTQDQAALAENAKLNPSATNGKAKPQAKTPLAQAEAKPQSQPKSSTEAKPKAESKEAKIEAKAESKAKT